MSFGLQTFNEDGSVDFDSNSPLMRVIHRQTVTESTSIIIQDYPPPYFVIVLTRFAEVASQPKYVTPVTHDQSGNTINIVYRSYVGPGQQPSVSFPATVLVCK